MASDIIRLHPTVKFQLDDEGERIVELHLLDSIRKIEDLQAAKTENYAFFTTFKAWIAEGGGLGDLTDAEVDSICEALWLQYAKKKQSWRQSMSDASKLPGSTESPSTRSA